jgi:hypothetical protein
MHPKHYRIRIFFDICRAFILPIAGISLVTSLANVRLGYLAFPCHIFAVTLCAGARILYSDFIQSRETKQLGARRVPRIVGKWPGNVDILFSMMRSFKTSYLVDTYLDLFEKYQSTTLNLRILWVDQVSDTLLDLCSRTSAVNIQAILYWFSDGAPFNPTSPLDYNHGQGPLKIRVDRRF